MCSECPNIIMKEMVCQIEIWGTSLNFLLAKPQAAGCDALSVHSDFFQPLFLPWLLPYLMHSDIYVQTKIIKIMLPTIQAMILYKYLYTDTYLCCSASGASIV